MAAIEIPLTPAAIGPPIEKTDATGSIIVELRAHPATAAVASVDFYRSKGAANFEYMGTAIRAPWTLTLLATDPGSRTVIAIGRDVDGAAVELSVPTTMAIVIQVPSPPPPPPPPPGPLSSLPLIQPAMLEYQGAFRLPAHFSYTAPALAWSSERQSLFISGGLRVTEITVPPLRTGPVSGMAVATEVQPWTEATEGRAGLITTDANGIWLLGLLAYEGRLVQAFAPQYADAPLSHCVGALDFRVTGDAKGPLLVGPGLRSGYLSGYMGTIPQAWQASLGGPALAGNGCLPILSRTSWGPALVAFDPADLGVTVPAPATGLVYYPDTHPTLGGTTSTGARFNGTARVNGVCFPEGTRSVLVWGRIGVGQADYGTGTTNKALHHTPVPGYPNDLLVYDPVDQDKGYHAYPYEYRVWAYDALDLVAAKEGKLQPWEVEPYAVWEPDFGGLSSSGALIQGVAYDPATGRIFVAQRYMDGGPPTDRPIIAVFSVAL